MIFKEWVKVRWFLLLYTLLAVLAVAYIFIRVRHDITFHEANNYWYFILFQGHSWFRLLRYIPLAGGLVLAVAQYFPETVNKRIKLTFHLPVEENRSLLMMMQFSYCCDYYRERFRVYCGEAAENDALVASQLLKFLESAFTTEKKDIPHRPKNTKGEG